MAISIKPLDQISQKWLDVAGGAGSFYEAGIAAPRRPWASSTLLAAPNFRAAVQAANIQALFERGVRDAGDAKWASRAKELGVSRYSQGIAIAEDAYTSGFAPYHSAISRIDLPKRQPRGSDANMDRVRVIARELHAIRVGRAVSR